jgi:hypothetical protein
MAKESQNYQAAQDAIEQEEKDAAAAETLAERRSGQAPRTPDEVGDPPLDPHDRAGLDEATEENGQHPFHAEVAAQVEPLSMPYAERMAAAEAQVTTDEYGEKVSQPYGESDEQGDTTTPRTPESGHTEEDEGDAPRRDARPPHNSEEKRGGVTGT